MELTKRLSAESSIRPYIARDPERTFAFLRECAADPNPHVGALSMLIGTGLGDMGAKLYAYNLAGLMHEVTD